MLLIKSGIIIIFIIFGFFVFFTQNPYRGGLIYHIISVEEQEPVNEIYKNDCKEPGAGKKH